MRVNTTSSEYTLDRHTYSVNICEEVVLSNGRTLFGSSLETPSWLLLLLGSLHAECSPVTEGARVVELATATRVSTAWSSGDRQLVPSHVPHWHISHSLTGPAGNQEVPTIIITTHIPVLPSSIELPTAVAADSHHCSDDYHHQQSKSANHDINDPQNTEETFH